jgi:hypothetical protein
VDGLWKRLTGLLKLGHLPKNYPNCGRLDATETCGALVIEKLCYHARFSLRVLPLEIQYDAVPGPAVVSHRSLTVLLKYRGVRAAVAGGGI